MQIIVSPLEGENFLLDVAPDAPTEVLRLTIAERMHVEPSRIKIVCEGLELSDGAPVSDFYVQNLSTVRVVVLPPAGGAPSAAASHAAAAAPAPADDSSVLNEAEIARAIVVTGIPTAEPAITEKAMLDFNKYGEIARVIFQDEAPPSGGGVPVRQHAVIVFHREASAVAALAADGSPVLGAPVRVQLASGLGGPRAAAAVAPGVYGAAAGAGGVGAGVPLLPRRLAPAVDRLSHLLAQGYLYGVQGVAHLRQYDEEHRLSQRIRVVAEQAATGAADLNRRYRIIPTLQATYEMAAAQAAELDRRYEIRANVEAGTTYLLQQSISLGQRALADPRVASTVTAAKTYLEQAAAAISATLAQARAEVAALDHPGARFPPTGAVGAATVPAGPMPSAAAASASHPAPAGTI